MADMVLDSIHFSDRMGLVRAARCLDKMLPLPGVEVTYLCIGSDLSTGDCFGPLTGTLISGLGVKNVVGTLDAPVHAKNMEEKLLQVPRDHHIVAIDATMGYYRDVGNLNFIMGPIRPGAAMNRDLPQVGHTSVVFNAAPYGLANFLVISCASFNKVWQGSNLLARAICLVSYRRRKALA